MIEEQKATASGRIEDPIRIFQGKPVIDETCNTIQVDENKKVATIFSERLANDLKATF